MDTPQACPKARRNWNNIIALALTVLPVSLDSSHESIKLTVWTKRSKNAEVTSHSDPAESDGNDDREGDPIGFRRLIMHHSLLFMFRAAVNDHTLTIKPAPIAVNDHPIAVAATYWPVFLINMPETIAKGAKTRATGKSCTPARRGLDPSTTCK